MRYERQLIIPQIGQEGQKKLEKSTVTVIGTGGLGSPVLTYLTSAGVGTIRIFDDDVVSVSNLNRQFLHNTGDVGKLKTLSAKEKLSQLNPSVHLMVINDRLNSDNAEDYIAGSDVVVDCVDNLATRMNVARACLKLNIPLVEGGVYGFSGYVMDIGRECACLSCLGYDEVIPKTPIPVLGVTAGVIGCMQANECIKLLLGIGEPFYGRMLSYDGLRGTWDEISVEKSDSCPVHGTYKKGRI
ncbi:HesA/MoeB/ThiF family protein [Neobacillus sp. LXY-4]|uniref:HesA/MoeB/ThiF family protein n=1 Tax=Neobacillus sp. LXY-4 TaxID=3379826 RepID=UPI003EE17716